MSYAMPPVNVDLNKSTNQSINLSALKDRLDPQGWTDEKAVPVEINDGEISALQDAAMARGTNGRDAMFLGQSLIYDASPELAPALRLAYARTLAVSPRPADSYASDDVRGMALALHSALIHDRLAEYLATLAARFDWPTIVKRNSDARRQAEAEREAERHRAEVVREAQQCWAARKVSDDGEVHAEMLAHQQRERDKLRTRGYTEDEARLELARRGLGYDDGNFFLTDNERLAIIAEASQRKQKAEEAERAAERQAILDEPAFSWGNVGEPLFDYFDPGPTELLPRYRDPGVLYFFGPKQSFKSTLVTWALCKALAEDPGLRVLYFAGELADHIRKMALAYGTEFDLPEADVQARFFIRSGGGSALGKPENAEMVVGLASKLGAGIVAFDTWARAIIGMREIDDAAMKLIGEDGPIGQLLAEGVTVVCIGHTSLGDKTRMRGHGGPGDAAYQNTAVAKTKTGFKAEVQTLRGGKPEQLRTVYAAVDSGEVPVIAWRTKAEHDPRIEEPTAEAIEEPAVSAEPGSEPERPLTRHKQRAEKAKERAQRNRDRRQQPPPSQFDVPAVW